MSEENKTDRRNPEFVAITFSLIESFPKMSKEQAGDAIQTISKYAISIVNGKPAEIDDLSNEICSIMALGCAKSTIDRTLNQFFIKSENGKKGGAPKGNQNARKKKRPEPEQEPEEVAEDLTDEAEPVPDPDPEPDREPEPDEPLVIDSIAEWRIARMFTELYRKPNNFADFHGGQLAELLAYMSISGSFSQWLEQLNELDTLDAVRELSKREFYDETPDKDYEAEFMSAKETALNIIQYSIGSTLAAIEEYIERQ